MANTIYLQLFSPMSTSHFAQEDNQIQQLAESSGKGRYCGAGTAKLIYPYEHVLKYCALKWAVQGLDESWLHLDQLFQEKKQRYDQDVKRGMQREKPERGKSYLEDLEHLATRQSKLIFSIDKCTMKHVKEQRVVSSELRNQNCFRSCRKLCTTNGAKR